MLHRRTRALAAPVAFGLAMALAVAPLTAQQEEQDSLAALLAGLPLRGIGPALMSGRIADLAIHPHDHGTWYVAAGSGGVWKTVNAGTTFEPVFDGEGSYSIGCVTVDANDPEVVWVGTGENVSGRHVGWGDGVYKSRDGGKSWTRTGLERSEHVARILVDPRDSQVVWVAAEGPLWSSGGERGVFKSTDGGETWRAVLEISPDTGVASLEPDPDDPDTLYAAAHQRRRQVWSYQAGGPESGIWKSSDGGETWREVTRGLPQGDMGKIGLAVSPVDTRVVYATIEASEEERGFYRSLDRGESWEKRNGYLSNGTGPHYYQEIYASPFDRDLVFQMDVWIMVTRDGGKTFEPLGERDKHSDNHALAFFPGQPERLLAGSDGGLYETHDHGATWRYAANLPLTQSYKLAVSQRLPAGSPYYEVLIGTQDNGSQHGPIGTPTTHGIRNSDWIVPFGADGYACAIDPTDPDILYVSWQTGHPLRYDAKNGELVDIQPQPEPGEEPERYNWDAPILISPHDPARLYYGSYRLWRSDDRGNSWRAISGDLTTGANRYQLPMLEDRVWSVDALYDNGAMSWYATLTAIAESPRVVGLLYTGTDDGLIQVSEDGGATWRRAELPGVPARAFVNEVKASPVDADTAFVALDNHKAGDYAPYLFVSRDRGRTWRSIRGDLPDGEIVWSIEQDHVNPDLLFLGAERGLWTSLDGGATWRRLAGAPVISFRDVEIQRARGDLVGASFGRGVFVLDDYTPLRQLDAETMAQEGALFPVRDAPWFVPATPLATRGRAYQGSSDFTAPNPPHGAVFTYFLRDDLETAGDSRREREKELAERRADVPFPGWETLREEALEDAPRIVLTVRDERGRVVRRVPGPAKRGLHRVVWDLRLAPFTPVRLGNAPELPPWADPPRGPLVPPGTYTVELARQQGGTLVTLGEAQEVAVVRSAPGFALDPQDAQEVFELALETGELQRLALGGARELARANERLAHLEAALLDVRVDAALAGDDSLQDRVDALQREAAAIGLLLVRDPLRGQLDEPSVPSILDRVSQVVEGSWNTRYGPTGTHRRSLEIAGEAWEGVRDRLRALIDRDLPALEAEAERAGARWTPGRALPPR
ncbi:MAG TPA: glycosyl hydrolase [Thermoanaerobaculia bacterium]|nr:glycosyl hydrolase [Thermoanaerobaculia bacterium]